MQLIISNGYICKVTPKMYINSWSVKLCSTQYKHHILMAFLKIANKKNYVKQKGKKIIEKLMM